MEEGKIIVERQPERSEWRCYPFGKQKTHNIIYTPIKGQEPNAFHRFMQRLFFGVHWEKDDNDKGNNTSKGSNGV
jgi:hypothetical protein